MPGLIVTDLDAEKRAFLESKGVRDFRALTRDDEIRYWSVEKLKDTFYHPSKHTFDIQGLIYNIIWQAYTKLQAGTRVLFRKDIRGFWYTDVKTPLGILGLFQNTLPSVTAMVGASAVSSGEGNRRESYLESVADEPEDGPRVSTQNYLCGEMTKAFDAFVRNHIFSFSGFGFKDPIGEYRFLGTSRFDVIFALEKRGMEEFAEGIRDEFGCHAVCLGGQPKLESTGFFCEELAKKIDLATTEVLILSFTDYDPAGKIIAENFQIQLKTFGVGRSKLINLVTLELFTPFEIAHCKVPLAMNSRTEATIVREWVAQTGGVNGEPYGIECDNVEPDRVKARIRAALGSAGK